MRQRSVAGHSIALAVVLFLVFGSVVPANADEGMWTFDNFPAKAVGQKYGFTPSQAWLDHVRNSTVRLLIGGAGCSGSFVSAHGLVMTNHHCIDECAQQLSTPENNLITGGFVAAAPQDEKACPDAEIDQLQSIRDVTAVIRYAIGSSTGADANAALRTEEAALQDSCGHAPDVRCDIVSLYRGGEYALYHYKRYTDVRLVFAPEAIVAQFGGDPDNFNFPRYDYDTGFVRVYENGKPLDGHDFLHWSVNGSTPGQLVFSAGNPGPTSRLETVAQLLFERANVIPEQIGYASESRGLYEDFIGRGPAQAREADQDLFMIDNALKEFIGAEGTLLDGRFMAAKQREETHTRALVAKNHTLAKTIGDPWKDLENIQTARATIGLRAAAMGRGLTPGLLGTAIALVRAGDERTKRNGDRLPEFTDQAMVTMGDRFKRPIPVFKDLQEAELTLALERARRRLGPDDAFIRKLLGKESPAGLAHRLVAGTQLDDPAVRTALFTGGAAAIAASTDPMIRFAVLIDPDLRAARSASEAAVDAPTRAATERIAAARFALYGRTVAPDGTFAPRISYGTVTGFPDTLNQPVPAYTTVGGLYDRATGSDPFRLPQSWISARSSLDPKMPMNLVSTNDITSGNSGSPMIDKNAQIVGLIFDGNIYSLGGDYGYDIVHNRAVAVDSRILLAAMRTVYHADRLASEIEAGRR